MIELAAEWDGEPGVFAKAVCHPDHNFIDRREDGQFEIHDFYEHAPDYVKKRIDRENQRKRKVVKRRRIKTYSGGQSLTTADNGGKSLPDEPNRTEPNRTETNLTQPNQAEPNRTEADPCRPSASGIGSACSRGAASKPGTDEIELVTRRFAELETNSNQRNTSMWRTRVRAMARLPGGLLRCDEILNEVESRRNPRVAETKGMSTQEIKNEASWANQQTQQWLREHERQRAS
jgi:hypothetical protein